MYFYKKKINIKNAVIALLIIYSLIATLQIYSCNKLGTKQNEFINDLIAEKVSLKNDIETLRIHVKESKDK